MNIQPGMLCLVIGGRNAGRECTVLRRVRAGEYIPEAAATSTEDAWWVKGPHIEIEVNDVFFYYEGYAAETSLMPLANGQDDAIVKSEVTDYVAG